MIASIVHLRIEPKCNFIRFDRCTVHQYSFCCRGVLLWFELECDLVTLFLVIVLHMVTWTLSHFEVK